MLHYLRTYEGRVKVFLVLLVLFLAAAVTVNFYLLMLSRDTVMGEIGQRILLVGESTRLELGLPESRLPGEESRTVRDAALSQARLARLTKEHNLSGMDLLDPAGRILVSSLVGRVGTLDRDYAELSPAQRRGLEAGNRVLGSLRDAEGIAYATLPGFLPLLSPSGRLRAVLKVEEHAGDLAQLDRSLKVLSAVQAAGLSCLVLLVLLFARWLLAPYRRLLATAEGVGEATGVIEKEASDPDILLHTFQAVLEKLKGQERELQHLKSHRREGSDEDFPGESLARSLNSGMMAFDATGVVRLVNPAALQILGRSQEEMVGRRLGELFEETEGLGRLLSEGLGKGAPRSREMVPHRRPDGKEIHLGVGLSPIHREAGENRGLICLLSDLTEIRLLRDRVALKENLAQLGELSAGIAHEFRNALATLQGYGRLLQRCRDEEARNLAASILREVGNIGAVVGEFLQFARPAALSVSEVDLRGLLEGLSREMSEPSGSPPFIIRLAGVFPRLSGDESLLRRAFHNLLLNASQARNGKGVEVTVTGATEGRTLRIEVADNGKGIPPAILPRIFTPFFTTRVDGTGLGLPLVQKAIVSHDGSIEVASQEGQGTRFLIRLPLGALHESFPLS